jgi:hypothetical protein
MVAEASRKKKEQVDALSDAVPANAAEDTAAEN